MSEELAKHKGQTCRIIWERAGEAGVVIMSGKNIGKQGIVPSSELDRADHSAGLRSLSDEELLRKRLALRKGRVSARASQLAARLAKAKRVAERPTNDPALRVPNSAIQRVEAAGGPNADAIRQQIKDGLIKPIMGQ